MNLPMYSASVTVLARMLGSMLHWLDKAEAHAAARKFDNTNYLGPRLAPDILPFVRQVQIACDGAKGCVARLAHATTAYALLRHGGVELGKRDYLGAA